jgi:hypothetical protein
MKAFLVAALLVAIPLVLPARAEDASEPVLIPPVLCDDTGAAPRCSDDFVVPIVFVSID